MTNGRKSNTRSAVIKMLFSGSSSAMLHGVASAFFSLSSLFLLPLFFFLLFDNSPCQERLCDAQNCLWNWQLWMVELQYKGALFLVPGPPAELEGRLGAAKWAPPVWARWARWARRNRLIGGVLKGTALTRYIYFFTVNIKATIIMIVISLASSVGSRMKIINFVCNKRRNIDIIIIVLTIIVTWHPRAGMSLGSAFLE